MRVLGILMHNAGPLQLRVQFTLHAGHEILGEPLQIHPLSEFRRKDQLKQACIACRLPVIKMRCEIFDPSVGAESGPLP